MRILWVAGKYLDVSVDRITWIEMTKQLERLGHGVRLVSAFRRTKNRFDLDGRVTYLPSIKMRILGYLSFNVSLFVYLGYYLVMRRPDVLVVTPLVSLTVAFYAMMKKLRIIRTRFVLDVRTIPVEYTGVSGRIKKAIFGADILFSKYLFDGMTVITPFMKEVLGETYGLQDHRLGVWASGTNLERFDPGRLDGENVEALRKRLHLEDKFVVMYHGVLSPSRGLRQTVEAMHSIVERYPDIALLFVGGGTDRAVLERMVHDFGLQDRVIFEGEVSHEAIPSYIALADVGILPFPRISWWRVSSPIKLMEYLAMGKPVIVTEIEAHRDVLGSNGFGIFIPSEKPEDVAQGILEAYARRKDLKDVVQEGRQLIRDRYTWNQQAVQLADYLKSTCER